MKTIKYLFITLLTSTLFVACSSDDDNPPPVNEEEVITTMTITLTPQGAGDTVTLQTRDLDGDGPNAPLVTVTGNLSLNTTYNGSVILLDESDPDDVENITEEVQEESDEHQFFYTLSNNLGTVSYSDLDENNNPVGLLFSLQTVASTTATEGLFTATLRHELNKDAEGVSNGNIANAGGETDISESFTVSIQ
ncbi:type 1 periplasmic binding fold superfamily protein [Winogradskyella ursingii]|uniref:type 1 periplasmic binding fold superfamily protein n=1 Tax=Winogradskyella ursingii TaxID=2686079 RepID=UPI0015C76992|nr:type 1 periplasmic binding fold superfamily protein [Winogradskyella ursingii]